MFKIKIFSLLSFLFISLYLSFFAKSAFASTLYLSPGSRSVGVGSVISVQIRLSTGGDGVNAVSAYLSYPSDKLDVAWISTSGSAFGIGADASSGGGSIRVSRGNIGAVSGDVNVATIGLRGKALGNATVAFVGGSGAPRASDSSDSLNLGASAGGNYNVIAYVPPPPSSTQESTTDQQSVAVDATAPKIIAASVLEIATNSARINWQTNEQSDSTVEYGLDKGVYFLTLSDSTQVTLHSIKLEGKLLEAGLKLHYRIKSKDSSGNEVSSDDKILQLKGYKVKVRVTDNFGIPAGNTPVYLYSDPIQSKTDVKGEAIFTNVIAGKHLVVAKLASGDKTLEINVAAKNQEQFFNFSVLQTPQSGLSANNLYVVGLVLVLFAIVGGWWFFKIKRKSKTIIVKLTNPKAPNSIN
ncbi:hypothetical protein HY025_05840 [Candidatus Daviesbacteria bacterium]|nr:hypothetical protein [Candidatus Daviesbacteria bacterium]